MQFSQFYIPGAMVVTDAMVKQVVIAMLPMEQWTWILDIISIQ
jgi:hypothetical protein